MSDEKKTPIGEKKPLVENKDLPPITESKPMPQVKPPKPEPKKPVE